ncbi:MAG TPA: oligosaccharide flippase family protein [Ktedonobacteraceae bacterium]|nr:oligosaccharide flippase family protein [Ktedonobacteraceae bacterium]
MSTLTIETKLAQRDTEAQYLLKRTPSSYLFGQAYGLWLYLSLFLFTLLIIHHVSPKQYGMFATIQTAMNTILYIIALGLEDAIVTFFPRVSAGYGKAAAAQLIRRVLGVRCIVLLASVGIIIFSLPTLATLVTFIPIKGATDVARWLKDPALQAHTLPIAIYVLGTGITNLLMAVCAARMRMYQVFFIGSAGQLLLLTLSYIALLSGWSIDGVLWMQAIVGVLSAIFFASWLAPLLTMPSGIYTQPLKPVLQVGMSAWQTNLVSGALLKQVSLILLTIFAISLTSIGYFNLSFQLADAANTLLVAGLTGVGGSALAAAFIGNNYERLARSWQTLIKVETLLAAPGLVFCLFNASNIAHAIYGSQYDSVGPLLAIFVFFNILTRVIGTTIHQYSLYVIGKSRLVALSQWISLLLVIGVGCVTIPLLGPAGALIADGVARTVTGVLLLTFLLNKLPRQYLRGLLGFTWRLLLAPVLAASPSIFWHPSDHIPLGVSGIVFVLLCLGWLLVIKPLTAMDIEMVEVIKPRIAHYLRWFARE